ncbi:DUF5107 domain-containing protein [Tessaracoccus sp. OS52]|uniref:DUF5107 domain-containing protein n=1 Tax=Tessaracoccus sp. OS52 TaxID=2886691 RepID=UPI001D127070|nr:DUF5107 domain-containing protein [Tessaracoccus sp. OS52]MCC2594426.1 DUF5107 domain-containing protein [Tessaracoccus sp. OS52]
MSSSHDGDRAPSPSPRPAPTAPAASTVRRGTLTIPAAGLGAEGLPILGLGHENALSSADRELLGEQPGRRLADRPVSVLPYCYQSSYDRVVTDREFDVVELTNEHLRATFLPELGGRLWSLVDLESGRDLLFQPDAIWFGNLALRDAWFAGGIEWNLGITGHWGLTCSPVGAGIVDVEGQQILRMWAYERLSGLVWRLEAWLPSGSRHLFTSARLVNHHDHDVPLYWWSNAAVPLASGARVLAPASSAFHNDYEGNLVRVGIPEAGHDVDASRPLDAPRAADYFYDTAGPDGEPVPTPWVAVLDDEGPGTLLSSTSELPGKKQFVWGNTRGGHRWQTWLSGEGRYLELQSGYARTQREHIALAPGERVSWVEAFGPVTGPPPEDYDAACSVVAAQVPQLGLERARAVFDAAADVAPEVLRQADGWGRVEVEAGHLPADPAVPFDAELTPDQSAWVAVAKGEALRPELAGTPQVGPEWEAHIRDAGAGWVRDLMLGYCAWSAGDQRRAVELWQASVAAEPNAMALHCLAASTEDGWDSFDLAERAHEAAPDDDNLLIDYLFRAQTVPTLVLRVIDRLTPERQALPRVQLALARALVSEGRLVTAKAVIDDLVLPNLREASHELDDLWRDYTQAAGTLDPLPLHLDFRMH